MQSSLEKAVDKDFCDQGQFYYENKVNSNNQIFACLGVSLVTINPDN